MDMFYVLCMNYSIFYKNIDYDILKRPIAYHHLIHICPVDLPHGASGWSAVCDCGIS